MCDLGYETIPIRTLFYSLSGGPSRVSRAGFPGSMFELYASITIITRATRFVAIPNCHGLACHTSFVLCVSTGVLLISDAIFNRAVTTDECLLSNQDNPHWAIYEVSTHLRSCTLDSCNIVDLTHQIMRQCYQFAKSTGICWPFCPLLGLMEGAVCVLYGSMLWDR